jgi:hypothetical protein
MFLKRKKSQCFGASSFSKFNHTRQKKTLPRLVPSYSEQNNHCAIDHNSERCSYHTDLGPLTHGSRVPGLGQITWWIVMPKKMRGHSRKKLHKNRKIIVLWIVRVVGAQGQLTQGPNVPISETKYKRSNSIFFVTSVALICARMCTQLLQPLAQSLIGSPGTLHGSWSGNTVNTNPPRGGGVRSINLVVPKLSNI